MYHKRLLILPGLLILLILGAYAGGGQGTVQPQTGADPYANLPREVSVMVPDRGVIPVSEGTYDNNRWTRWANENAPVRVTYIPVPRSEIMTRLTALLAAGSAPDIMWDFGRGIMDTFYDQGVIQPLDELIEKYSTGFKAYMRKHPEVLPYMYEDDGRLWGMMNVRPTLGQVDNMTWIRKDWLDKFGLGVPKTTGDLITFMRRVRGEDPDGNGVQDTWGMVFDNVKFDGYLRTMFGAPGGGYLITNGHLVNWETTQGYRDYLEFKAMLYREKYIDPEYITDTQNQRGRQFAVTGKGGVFIAGFNIERELPDLWKNVPTAEYIPIEPFTSSQGKFGYAKADMSHKVVVINKTARNPKACIEFLDWCITEGWKTLTFGLEGVNYRLINGIPQVIDGELNRVQVSWLRDTNSEFSPLSDYDATPDWLVVRSAQDPMSQKIAELAKQACEISLALPYNIPVPFWPYSETASRFNTETIAQVTAYETDIVMGRISLDEGLRRINDFRKGAGGDTVDAERDAWYQANKSRL
jgi:putative aldouronate transport system substrate-binding protein